MKLLHVTAITEIALIIGLTAITNRKLPEFGANESGRYWDGSKRDMGLCVNCSLCNYYTPDLLKLLILHMYLQTAALLGFASILMT